MLLAVQSDKFLALLRPAHDNPVACDRVVVIGVHRLSVLFHDIIGNVDDIVDRADAVGSEPPLHPLRRGTDLDIFHDAGGIARAQIRIAHFHLDVIIDVFVVPCFPDDRLMELLAERGRRFSCDADDRIAVHAVRRNLVFKHGIMQAEQFDRIRTDFRILREYIDPVRRSFRIEFTAASELIDGADHAK